MQNIIEKLDVCIKIDRHIIYEFDAKVTQENIITSAQTIRAQLIDKNIDNQKIDAVYEIAIEILQNVLKYSYGNKIDEDKIREADGKFGITYDSIKNRITLKSCNLINTNKVELIKQRVKEVSGLNAQELRKLFRSKMKTRKDNHDDGAGLGFITIASKASQEIKVDFETIINGVEKYSLEVVV